MAQQPALADQARSRLEREYVAAFLPYGLVPVLLPRGQAVGDVLDNLEGGGGFRFRAADLFDGLVPDEVDSTLPQFDIAWTVAANLALGVETLASAEAQGKIEDRVTLHFEQVRASSASLYRMRQHLKPEVAPEVMLLLAADKVDFDGAPEWLLIGEVIYAAAVVTVTRARGGGGKADLGFLGRLSGGAVKAAGGADLARAETAEIRAPKPVPVAFRPARLRATAEIASAFKSASVLDFRANDEDHLKALEAWALRTLRPISATPPSPPSDASGERSAASPTPSHPKNAPTNSTPTDRTQHDRKPR